MTLDAAVASETPTSAPLPDIDVSALSADQLDAALQGDLPPAAEESAATTPAADAGTSSAEPEKETMVPHRAVHEERQRRKSVEHELAQVREQSARMLQQLRDESIQMKQYIRQQAAPPPDPETDPLGAIRYETQTVAQEVKALRETQAQTEQDQREAQARHALMLEAAADEATFRKSAPDYDKAMEYARDSRLRQYAALGVPEQVAVQRVANEIVDLALHAKRTGQSPAELAYNYALAMGFQKQPAVTPAQKLDMQRAGQAAAKPSGANPRASTSLEALAAMDNDEFAKFASDPKAWARLWS